MHTPSSASDLLDLFRNFKPSIWYSPAKGDLIYITLPHRLSSLTDPVILNLLPLHIYTRPAGHDDAWVCDYIWEVESCVTIMGTYFLQAAGWNFDLAYLLCTTDQYHFQWLSMTHAYTCTCKIHNFPGLENKNCKIPFPDFPWTPYETCLWLAFQLGF